MARPQKAGLDYFPLDVDMDQDDKIQLIEAQFGIIGFGIVVKLFMKIYKEGYYYEWTEKEQLIFSRRINVDIKKVNDVINECLKWGLLNKELYDKYAILSSKGIQRRYVEAANRRKKIEIIKQYCLINIDDYINVVNVDVNPVNVINNPPTEPINVDINPQSKEKKSKEKKETYIYPPNSSEVILSEYLLSLIKRHLPNIREPDIQKWAKHMNALIRIDGRDPPEVKAVIEFAQTSEFWQGNILSTDKLRKQYDTLNAQRLRNMRNNDIRSNPKKTSYPGDDYEIYDKFSRSRPSSEDDDKFSRRGKSFCDI